MTTPNPETLRRLTKARAAMLLDQPFFGTLALRLQLKVMTKEMEAWFVSKSRVPTLAVDGKHIWYCERYVDNLDFPLVISAIAHEVGHCVFDHTSRRGDRDPDGWNRAGDYVINQMLKDANMPLGDKWLYNPGFAGMTTDEIYALMPRGGGGGGGGGGGSGDDASQDYVLDGDPSEQTANENDWKVATVQAATAAKAQGKLPGSLQRFVDEIMAPKNDWRERLNRFICERSRDGYSWMRPNRRYLSAGLYLPSRYSEVMETLVVVTDDSGSIGDEILKVFGSETSAARDAARPNKTIVISCDARVNHVVELEADDPFKVENHGGGGTDFHPPFNWLEERGIKPGCLLYLTDMYGTFPKVEPDYPVMWCSISPNVKAPWGETIHIEV